MFSTNLMKIVGCLMMLFYELISSVFLAAHLPGLPQYATVLLAYAVVAWGPRRIRRRNTASSPNCCAEAAGRCQWLDRGLTRRFHHPRRPAGRGLISAKVSSLLLPLTYLMWTRASIRRPKRDRADQRHLRHCRGVQSLHPRHGRRYRPST